MIYNKLVKCPFCECEYPARTNFKNKLHEEQSNHQIAVEKFMDLGNQQIPIKPTIPSLEVRKLRTKLILEEALETIKALGFNAYSEDTGDLWHPSCLDLVEEFKPDLAEILDGCCDLHVVTTGTLSACGIMDVRPQEIVDENNLEKFKWTDEEIKTFFEEKQTLQEGFKWTRKKIGNELYTIVFNKDGKIIKPPSHQKPKLEEEIKRQQGL